MSEEQLDHSLAENVMEWTPLRILRAKDEFTIWWSDQEGPTKFTLDTWQPTRRIEQAMLLLEKLIGDGTEGATPYLYWSRGLWHCQLSGLGSVTSAKTLQLAICKAVGLA